MTSNPVLSNYALIEWFENTLRVLIREVLDNAHGEEWWRKGVPLNIRKECAARNQEAQLKEEWKLSEMLFIDFHTYAELINKKKKIFGAVIGTKELDKLVKRLKELSPIRNAIMHCRGQYLSEETLSKLKESCFELEKVMEKVK